VLPLAYACRIFPAFPWQPRRCLLITNVLVLMILHYSPFRYKLYINYWLYFYIVLLKRLSVRLVTAMWGIRRNTRDLGYIAVFLIKLPMARKHEQQCVSNIVEATGSFVSFPQVECDKVGCCFDTVVNLFILGFFLTTPLFFDEYAQCRLLCSQRKVPFTLRVRACPSLRFDLTYWNQWRRSDYALIVLTSVY